MTLLLSEIHDLALDVVTDTCLASYFSLSLSAG